MTAKDEEMPSEEDSAFEQTRMSEPGPRLPPPKTDENQGQTRTSDEVTRHSDESEGQTRVSTGDSSPASTPEISTRAVVTPSAQMWTKGSGGIGREELPEGHLFAGKLRIIRKLGTGGFAVVYLAHDEKLGRDVAVKIPREGKSKDETRTLLNEAQRIGKIQSPNVVGVHEIIDSVDPPVVVMEHMAGGDLNDYVKKHRAMDPATFAGFARGLASGLRDAHARKVIHRDLTPKNILLDAAGTPKISDFGLAKALNAENQVVKSVFVGLAYFAPVPEEVEAMSFGPEIPSTVGPHSDVYQMGAIFHFMAVGVGPFPKDGDERRLALLHVPKTVGKSNPAFAGTRVEELIRRCLEKEPKLRPQDGAALLAELDRALAVDEAARRRRARRPYLIAVALTLLVLSVLGVVFRKEIKERIRPSVPVYVPQPPRPPTRLKPMQLFAELKLEHEKGAHVSLNAEGEPTTLRLGRGARTTISSGSGHELAFVGGDLGGAATTRPAGDAHPHRFEFEAGAGAGKVELAGGVEGARWTGTLAVETVEPPVAPTPGQVAKARHFDRPLWRSSGDFPGPESRPEGLTYSVGLEGRGISEAVSALRQQRSVAFLDIHAFDALGQVSPPLRVLTVPLFNASDLVDPVVDRSRDPLRLDGSTPVHPDRLSWAAPGKLVQGAAAAKEFQFGWWVQQGDRWIAPEAPGRPALNDGPVVARLRMTVEDGSPADGLDLIENGVKLLFDVTPPTLLADDGAALEPGRLHVAAENTLVLRSEEKNVVPSTVDKDAKIFDVGDGRIEARFEGPAGGGPFFKDVVVAVQDAAENRAEYGLAVLVRASALRPRVEAWLEGKSSPEAGCRWADNRLIVRSEAVAAGMTADLGAMLALEIGSASFSATTRIGPFSNKQGSLAVYAHAKGRPEVELLRLDCFIDDEPPEPVAVRFDGRATAEPVAAGARRHEVQPCGVSGVVEWGDALSGPARSTSRFTATAAGVTLRFPDAVGNETEFTVNCKEADRPSTASVLDALRIRRHALPDGSFVTQRLTENQWSGLVHYNGRTLPAQLPESELENPPRCVPLSTSSNSALLNLVSAAQGLELRLPTFEEYEEFRGSGTPQYWRRRVGRDALQIQQGAGALLMPGNQQPERSQYTVPLSYADAARGLESRREELLDVKLADAAFCGLEAVQGPTSNQLFRIGVPRTLAFDFNAFTTPTSAAVPLSSSPSQSQDQLHIRLVVVGPKAR